jgi:hypothetical protein
LPTSHAVQLVRLETGWKRPARQMEQLASSCPKALATTPYWPRGQEVQMGLPTVGLCRPGAHDSHTVKFTATGSPPTLP